MSKLVLQTALGAGLVAGLLRPESTQDILARVTKSRISLSTFKAIAGTLFGLGLLGSTNSYLSHKAYNNWTTDNTWDWSREIVVITGGSSGFGAILVRRLAEKGIKVVSLDINEPMGTLPDHVTFFKVDITSREEVHEVANKIGQQIGEPTVLVNNAGVPGMRTILGEPDGYAAKVFAVNIVSHYDLVREFLPHMIEKNHGHVVTVASAASFAAFANNTAYAGSKAAALAFHEGLGQELKFRYGAPKVRTTIVHPTWMRTNMIKDLTANPKFKATVLDPEHVAEALVKQILKGEGGQLIFAPGLASIIGIVRGLPWWIQEYLRDVQSGGSKKTK